MCLYPKLIKNRKYIANKKNGGIIPAITDKRILLVPIKCGKCMECRKQKGREWQMRLQEDIRANTNGKFVTLTFSNESIKKLINMPENKGWAGLKKLEGYELDNGLATRAVRLFTERWRKTHKKTIRHWLVTELGHEGTENVHMHGIVWTDESIEEIRYQWAYGYVYPRNEAEMMKNYVNEKTINYMVKYIHKIDEKHSEYNSIILSSKGIGKNYTNRSDIRRNKYKEGETIETYKTRQGEEIAMPIYLRNKIWTEEEREKLWIEKLDKNERWVNGVRVDIKENEDGYYRLLEEARKKNKRLGYGDDAKNWDKKRYENERRNLMYKERTKEREVKIRIEPEDIENVEMVKGGKIEDAW